MMKYVNTKRKVEGKMPESIAKKPKVNLPADAKFQTVVPDKDHAASDDESTPVNTYMKVVRFFSEKFRRVREQGIPWLQVFPDRIVSFLEEICTKSVFVKSVSLSNVVICLQWIYMYSRVRNVPVVNFAFCVLVFSYMFYVANKN